MKEQNVRQDNKMGTMPINKLLVSMSLPMMISMLVQAMYNIIDSVFVAKISEDALTAVSLAFPIQMLMISVGVGTGVGINALLSRSLGEKNYDEANRSATNGIFIMVISYLFFAVFGMFFSEMFFKTQTTDEMIVSYGKQYLSICTVFSFGIFMQLTMERLLQSTGRTFYTMITQGSGAIMNIILNPILIFGFFGFPKMGIAGAATATVLGQFIAMFMAIIFNIKKNQDIKINFRGFRPNARTIKNIYIVGVPSIVMQSINSVMTLGMNNILMTFSPTAVSVFGVYYKLNSFIFMPVFGLNNSMIPIIAYNYGARKMKRIIQAIKTSIVLAVSLMFIGLLIFQFIPDQLLGFFNASEQMLAIGIPALRKISLSFVFAGYCIVIISVFQAFGEGLLSLIISVARQLCVILPVAFIFAKLFGIHAVWWAFPIAEVVAVTMSTWFFIRLYKRSIKDM